MKVDLTELRASDATLFGAKAANLGEIAAIGLSVPRGYVLRSDPKTAGAAIDVAELFEAFDALGGSLVAVRSSSTIEDSADASYAGIFHTSLNVDRFGLVEAYEQCLASATGTRVHDYQRFRSPRSAEGEIPIIVQVMLDPDVSGVCFTEHPVTRNAGESLIELVSGLGDGVVSGRTNPDSYLFDHQVNLITSAVPGDVRGARFDEPGASLLSRARRDLVKRIAQCCAAVHDHFGRPQDVEFAVEGGVLYVLQARPITT